MSKLPPFSRALVDVAHEFDRAFRSGLPIPLDVRTEFCETFDTRGPDQSLAAYARTVLLGPIKDGDDV